MTQEITLYQTYCPDESIVSGTDKIELELISDSLLTLAFEVVRKTYRETSKEDVSRWIDSLEKLEVRSTTLHKQYGYNDQKYYEHGYDTSSLPIHPQDLFHHIQDTMQHVAERLETLAPSHIRLLIDFLKQLEIKKNQQQ